MNTSATSVPVPLTQQRVSRSLRSEVHPWGVAALQEAFAGGRPAVGRRPPAVAQLQRQRRLRLAQTRRLLVPERQEGHQPEDVLHQQEPHHARPGEQVPLLPVFSFFSPSVQPLLERNICSADDNSLGKVLFPVFNVFLPKKKVKDNKVRRLSGGYEGWKQLTAAPQTVSVTRVLRLQSWQPVVVLDTRPFNAFTSSSSQSWREQNWSAYLASRDVL